MVFTLTLKTCVKRILVESLFQLLLRKDTRLPPPPLILSYHPGLLLCDCLNVSVHFFPYLSQWEEHLGLC